MIETRQRRKTYYSKAGDIAALKNRPPWILKMVKFSASSVGLSELVNLPLSRCINMLEVPTGGQVFVDGKELTAMRIDQSCVRHVKVSV